MDFTCSRGQGSKSEKERQGLFFGQFTLTATSHIPPYTVDLVQHQAKR